MSEAARLTAISAFLLKHRGCPLFHPYTVDTFDSGVASSGPDSEEFTKDLEALGPTFVKVGQMLSTRPDLLPPDYIAALGRLQDKALPCDFESIKTMIETELGNPIQKVFEEFDPIPVGTASFAQVHLARLRSGREVAVKVQRPNLASQVEADLLSIRRLISSLGLVSNIGTRLGFNDWLEEFRATVTDELDYLKEANNLDTFKELLKDYDQLSVPSPVWDYTTRRVLTMDRAKGIRVTDIPDVLRIEIDLHPLAETLCKAYLDQMFVHGLLHADPHPGNIVLTSDQSLILLDLGMVEYVAPRMRDQLLKLVLAVVDGRGELAAETFIHMGTRLESFDESKFTREVGRLVARFSMPNKGGSSEGNFLLMMVKNGAECGLRPPPELTLVGKTLLNLESVVRALDPAASMRDVLQNHLQQIVRARTMSSLDFSRMATDMLDLHDLVRESPRRLSVLLRTLADNRFRVHIDGLEEAHLIEGIQKVANRITAGVIAAAMIVGAALIMSIRTEHQLFGYPALALVMFLFAAALGAGLVLSSLYGDRTVKPKADRDPL